MGDRAANENNSLKAPGYFLLDGGLSYKYKDFEWALNFENLLNTEWNEAQFETESRLFDEPESVTELHFTPGIPFSIKVGISVFF